MNQSSRSRLSRNSLNVKSASSKTQGSSSNGPASQQYPRPAGSLQSKSFGSNPNVSRGSQSLKTQPSAKSGSRMSENSASVEKWEGRSQAPNYLRGPTRGRDESTAGKSSSVKKSKNSTVSSDKHRSKERAERRGGNKLETRRNRTQRESRRTSLPVYDINDSYFPAWGSDSESIAPQLLNDIMKHRIYDYPIKLQNEEDIRQWRKAYNLRHKMKQYDLSTRQKLYRSNMINPKAKFIREKYVFLNKIPEHRSAFPVPKDPTDVQKSNVIQTYLKTHAAFILSEKLMAKGNRGKLNHADQMKLMRALNNPLASFIGPDNYEKLKLGVPKHEKRKHKGGRTRTANQPRSHPLYAGFESRPLPEFGASRVPRGRLGGKSAIPPTQRPRMSRPKAQMHSSDVSRRRVPSGKELRREAERNAQRGILKPAKAYKDSVPMRAKGKTGKSGEPSSGKRVSSKKQVSERPRHKQDRLDPKMYNYEFSFDGKNGGMYKGGRAGNQKGGHGSRHMDDREYSDDSGRNGRMDREKREDRMREYSKENSYEENSSNGRTTASENSFYKSSTSGSVPSEGTPMNNYDQNNNNQFNFVPPMNPMMAPVGAYVQHVNGINVIEQPGIMNLIEIPSSFIPPPPVYEHPGGSGNIGFMNMINVPDPNCSAYSNPYNLNCDNYPTTIISSMPNGTSGYYQEPNTLLSNVPNANNGFFQEPTDMEEDDYRNKKFRRRSGDSSCSDSYTNDSTITEDYSRSVSSTGSSSNRSDLSFDRELKGMAYKTEAMHSRTKEDRYALAGNLKSKNAEDMNLRLFLKHL